MKVKDLIEFLKTLDQERQIGVMDDNCVLNILGFYGGDSGSNYCLSGSYRDELSNVGCCWTYFKKGGKRCG